MNAAVYLNNGMQAYLVRRAITDAIDAAIARGFTEKDPEVHELRASLPVLKAENALPIMEGGQNG